MLFMVLAIRRAHHENKEYATVVIRSEIYLITGSSMTLSDAYRRIKPSIVAIVRKYEMLNVGDPIPEIPFILGTGFIVADGLIATNNHVAKIIDRQPKPPETREDEWPIMCMMFLEMNENDCWMVPLNVLGKMEITSHDPKGIWYGDTIPDLAFICVKATGLPIVKLQPDWRVLQEGMELATAGFPMGRDSLTAPGYLHQIGPTLQKGVLGALLPFTRCRPHAFILNVVSQGGQSGSPVFLTDTGEVVGILYGGLEEPALTYTKKDAYQKTTAITYVLPAGLIESGMQAARKLPNCALPDDTLSLDDMIKKYPRHESKGPVRDSVTKKLASDSISILRSRT